ncbi:MAG: hypothetical protein GY832_36130, partial [Chloroflexi bacterium]|nr:hypothetical protein [Chloroflexota bacterium]
MVPPGQPNNRSCWNCGKSGHFARECFSAPAHFGQFQRPLFRPQYSTYFGLQNFPFQPRGNFPGGQRGGRGFGQNFGRGAGRGTSMYMDLTPADYNSEYPPLPSGTPDTQSAPAPTASQGSEQPKSPFTDCQLTYLQQLLAPPEGDYFPNYGLYSVFHADPPVAGMASMAGVGMERMETDSDPIEDVAAFLTVAEQSVSSGNESEVLGTQEAKDATSQPLTVANASSKSGTNGSASRAEKGDVKTRVPAARNPVATIDATSN